MEKYINFNTEKRIKAANNFEKDFFSTSDQFCLQKKQWKLYEKESM